MGQYDTHTTQGIAYLLLGEPLAEHRAPWRRGLDESLLKPRAVAHREVDAHAEDAVVWCCTDVREPGGRRATLLLYGHPRRVGCAGQCRNDDTTEELGGEHGSYRWW